MGLRFNRRLKILPGVTLNFSKSGVSTSFGVRGLRHTIGHGKRRTTVGLPGTGLSYTDIQTVKRRSPSSADRNGAVRWSWIWSSVGVVSGLALIPVAPLFGGLVLAGVAWLHFSKNRLS